MRRRVGVLLGCMQMVALTAWAGTRTFATFEEACVALGFDPYAPQSVVVVFLSDVHLNLSGTLYPVTTNLDARMLSFLNTLRPAPYAVLVGGDVSEALAPMPGWRPTEWSWRLGTNEFVLWKRVVQQLTNVGPGGVIWVPGNHDQLDEEADAETFRRWFPEMPTRQVVDVGGARFFLLNCGNFGGRSMAQKEWLRQQWVQTGPGRERIIVIHVPPFLQKATYRGLATDLEEVIGDYAGRLWVLSGHEHAHSVRAYEVGRARVAQIVVGTANPQATNGRSYDTGCLVLCLSNGVAGMIYWHLHDGRFRIVDSPNWDNPVRFRTAFQDAENLIFRRLKARGTPPEVVSLSAEDAVEWYAYTRSLEWRFPGSWLGRRPQEFLLLGVGISPGATLEVWGGDEQWRRVDGWQGMDNVYRFPLPADAGASDGDLRIRYTSPGQNDFIGGWALVGTGRANTSSADVGWDDPWFVVRPGEGVAIPVAPWSGPSAASTPWQLVEGTPGAWMESELGWIRWRVPAGAHRPGWVRWMAASTTSSGGEVSVALTMAVVPEEAWMELRPESQVWSVQDFTRVNDPGWMTPDASEKEWPKLKPPLGYGHSGLTSDLRQAWGFAPKSVAVRGWFRWEGPEQSGAAPTLKLSAGSRWQLWVNGQSVGSSDGSSGTRQSGRLSQSDFAASGGPNPVLSLPLSQFRAGRNLVALRVWADAAETSPRYYWPFDSPAEDWADVMSGERLARGGTNWASIPGRWGLAATNAGTSAGMEMPGSESWTIGEGFTVGGWFAYGWSSGNDPSTVAIEKPGVFALYYTGTRTNRYRFRVGQAEVEAAVPGILPGQWRLVVGWFDGRRVGIQVDDAGSWEVPAQEIPSGSLPIRLLRRSGGGGFAADEVFAFDRVLTSMERSRIYREGVQALLGTSGLWFDAVVAAARVERAAFRSVPDRVVGFAGQSLSLDLGVWSEWPARFQWFREGVLQPGWTNAQAHWDRLTGMESGRYTLVASNAAGSVTSPPVAVVVMEPVRLKYERGWSDEFIWLRFPGMVRLPDAVVPSAIILETSSDLVEWTEVERWEDVRVPKRIPVKVSGDMARFFRMRLKF